MLKLFRVTEDSMRPALEPGDGLVTGRLRRPRVGRLVVLRSPVAPDMWLVKRVAGVAGDTVSLDGEGQPWPVGDGEIFVLSDDREVTRADSRTFGPLPVAGVRRVLARLPRRFIDRPTRG